MAETDYSHACPNCLFPEPECFCDAIAMLWPQQQSEPQFACDDEIKAYLFQLEEEQNRKPETVGDDSGMPSGAGKQNKRKLGDATKKSIKKRSVDDDSWMPEGWVKKVNERPSRGKFPGYVDKKYYAPGLARAFRSKVEALRYIEKQKLENATTSGGDELEDGGSG